MLTPGTTVRVRLVKLRKEGLEYPMVVRFDDGDHLVVEGEWSGLGHHDLGYVRFEPGDVFVEHYWRRRWYSVKEILDGERRRKGWYCDVTRPVDVRAGELISVDLELDLWVSADGDTVLVLDEADFAASGLAETDPGAAAEARRALVQLQELAQEGFRSVQLPGS